MIYLVNEIVIQNFMTKDNGKTPMMINVSDP